MESKSNPYASFDPRPLIGKVYEEYEVTLSTHESILYALSIGFNLQD
jgi:acyl dehydratase